MPEVADRRYDPILWYRQYTAWALERINQWLPEFLDGAIMHRDVAYNIYTSYTSAAEFETIF